MCVTCCGVREAGKLVVSPDLTDSSRPLPRDEFTLPRPSSRTGFALIDVSIQTTRPGQTCGAEASSEAGTVTR